MDYLKGYASSIGDFLSNVSENITSNLSTDVAEATDVDSISHDDTDATEKFSGKGAVDTSTKEEILHLSQHISLANNPLVNYMNSLATFGSAPTSEETDKHTPTSESVVVHDPDEVTLPASVPSPDDSKEIEYCAEAYLHLPDWLNGITPKTGQVWDQMKQDFNEIVTVLTNEHKEVVNRTASSVRQGLSSVASAAKKIDPHQFSLLPEAESTTFGVPTEEAAPQESYPPQLSELTSLSSEFSHMFGGIMSALFGPEKTVVKDRREARLQILRADPATYELEPPPPPPGSNVDSYADWRAAYFDEANCQPKPGIPLCARQPHGEGDTDVENLIEPTHPSPIELLEEHPFMRTYLSQLVRVDDQLGGSISDADFWSRYYYRVWLLDVTERRRQQLTKRMESASLPSDSGTVIDNSLSDWFGASDIETTIPVTSSIPPPNVVPSVVQDATLVSSESPNKLETKPSGNRSAKRRQKKNSKHITGSDKLVESSASQTAVQKTSHVSPPLMPAQEILAQSNEDVSSLVTSDTPCTSSSSPVVLSNAEDNNNGGSIPCGDETNVQETKDKVVQGSSVNRQQNPNQIHSSIEDAKDPYSGNSDGDWGELSSDVEVIDVVPTSTSREAEDWDDWS